jgi:hypothetical protein
VKTQNEANLKYLDLEKKAKPLMRNTSRQWKRGSGVGDIRQRLATNQSSLVSYFLISRPTPTITPKPLWHRAADPQQLS